jgi:heme oxygenase
MNIEPSHFVRGQSTISLLREATAPWHQSLHEHPLMNRLLTHPSLKCYCKALQGFLAFYEPTEPVLIDSSRRLGVPGLYCRPERTEWLSSDLESLNLEGERFEFPDNTQHSPCLAGIGNLVGCLYVVKGSALGGRTILRQLSGLHPVKRACRFLTGDGDRTAQNWNAFQSFCNEVCRSKELRRAAVTSAQQTFVSIAQCLTWSENTGQQL